MKPQIVHWQDKINTDRHARSMQPHWLIQEDTRNDNARRLHTACIEAGVEVQSQVMADDRLPSIANDRPLICYGSCQFCAGIAASHRWSPGVWFDPEHFRFSRYLANYAGRMLNDDARLTTLEQVPRMVLPSRVFVRGDDDLKQLAGSLWSREQLLVWAEQLRGRDDREILGLPIVVASRKLIDYEWRLFLVAGRVVGASQYRRLGDLECAPDAPAEVTAFAEASAALWSPAPVFVMDVAAIGAELRILELNGFNSSGFYATRVTEVVRAVTDWVGVDHTPTRPGSETRTTA